MTEYAVVNPMRHENKPYAAGATIELEDTQAEFLLRAGFIRVEADEKPKTGGTATKDKAAAAGAGTKDKTDKPEAGAA